MAAVSPDVSVVMVTYNSEAYLRETLSSIQQQSVTNFELIIADDGSTDGTLAILKEAAASDPRVRLLACEHCGLRTIVGNTAFRAATSDLIVWLDDDDPMLPMRLETTLKVFRLALPNVGLMFSDYHVIDGSGRLLHESGLERYRHLSSAERKPLADGVSVVPQRAAFTTLLIGNYLRPSNVAMRRSCLDDVGLLDESLANGEDLDLFLRIARRWDFIRVDMPLGSYRHRPGSISSRGPLRLAPNRIRVLEKQLRQGMSMRQRWAARRKIAENLFDIGYAERVAGHYGAAARVLVRSFVYAVSWSTFKELVLAVMLQAFGRAS